MTKYRRLRSKPRLFEPELLLPDVTRKIGKPIRYSSVADRRAMERLWTRLSEPMRQAA